MHFAILQTLMHYTLGINLGQGFLSWLVFMIIHVCGFSNSNQIISSKYHQFDVLQKVTAEDVGKTGWFELKKQHNC